MVRGVALRMTTHGVAVPGTGEVVGSTGIVRNCTITRLDVSAAYTVNPSASFKNSFGYYGNGGSNYDVEYSCVWDALRPFVGTAKSGKGTIQKDPLLGPAFTLLSGSPCLHTGDPSFNPPHMGIYGGPESGPAGAR